MESGWSGWLQNSFDVSEAVWFAFVGLSLPGTAVVES